MADPIPFVVQTSGTAATAPDGAVPIDLSYGGALLAQLAALPLGTANQILKMNAGGTAVTWAADA